MGTLNLEKNDLLNLSKDYSKLNKINLGLGWDISNDSHSWDLDASAILLDSNNELIETVYYGRKIGNGIKLNGDNLTGAGDGDDEIISINLSEVPGRVCKIGLFVNIYAAGNRDFSKVQNAYIRMVDQNSNREICIYKLNESGKGFNAFHFANLEKDNNDWTFKAVGEGTNGSIDTLKTYFVKKMNTSSNVINLDFENKNTPKKSIFNKLFGK